MKKFTKILKNQKGLTLIELLAVIVILAIVAAIAVPSIGNVINNSKDKAILADASSILSGAKLAVTSGDCTATNATTTTCDATALAGYVEGIPLAGITAVKTGTAWNVTYSKLAEIKNTKFATGSFTQTASKFPTSISETDLNAALQK